MKNYTDMMTSVHFQRYTINLTLDELRKLINKWQTKEYFNPEKLTRDNQRMISTVYEKLLQINKSQF